jgi:S-layer protein (TIGR01567 family)
MLIGLLVSIFIACTCADALEFEGETVQVLGKQTRDIVWDENNFGGFCYDLGGGDCVGVETLTVEAHTLTGPDDRIIDKNCLIYTTSPIIHGYELCRNLGLTVDGHSGYWAEFWLGKQHIAIDGQADKLAKTVVEFNSTDTRTIAVGEEWDLGGGFVLKANETDVEGKKVWLYLYKDGSVLDDRVIDTGSSDLQKRVYTYTTNMGGEVDVPLFSCYVSAVFNGPCSNLVQIKYVFLVDDDVTYLELTGEDYGAMEVTTASSACITLENDDVVLCLDPGTTVTIMGDLSFKTTDNINAIEFYPHIIRDKPPVLSGGGGFVLDDCWIGYAWNLSENYSIAAKDVSFDGDKARIVLLKGGAVVDEVLLTEEPNAPVDSDCRYRYVKNGTEIINATLKAAFCEDDLNTVELTEVHQCSEIDGSMLINNGSHLFKSVNTGDVNRDDSITPADAVIALELAVSGRWDPVADVNGDYRVTSLDALIILQMSTDT